MKTPHRHRGFTLIAAIFLLVVVASLVIYMSNIRVVQQTTLVYGVQGARAMQAARTGIQWGISRSLAANSCPADTSFSTTDPALAAFSINVTCSESVHFEGAASITTFRLTSTASSGVPGTLDFVQRLLQATVSLNPP